MDVLFVLLIVWLAGCLGRRRQGGGFSSGTGNLAKSIIRGQEELEEKIRREMLEAIGFHKKGIRRAIAQGKTFKIILPCQYRITISGDGASCEPCSENIVV